MEGPQPRCPARTALLVALPALAGAWPAYALAGGAGLAALGAAALAALLGVAAGRAAGRQVPGGRPESHAQAALVGITVRLLVTAALALAVALAAPLPRSVFLVSLAVFYALLLAAEVRDALALQAAADDRPRGWAP
jgi:hypothetical protein